MSTWTFAGLHDRGRASRLPPVRQSKPRKGRGMSRRKGTAALSAVMVAALVASVGVLSGGAGAAGTSTYLVVYKGTSVPSDAASSIQKAGGSIVATYGQIGVVVAASSNASFASNAQKDNKVDGAAATAGFATSVGGVNGADDNAPVQPGTPAPGSDSLSGLQWDMVQIHDPQARAINGGSPSILIGDLDTGLDYTHPDLAPNVDDAASANCVGGVAVPGKVAAMDDNGHGTHTAGIMAAALNGIGIVGVAPNVRIAGVKVG